MKRLREAKLNSDRTQAAYKIKSVVLNSASFGLPQNRERVYIMGVRQSTSLKRPMPTISMPTVQKPRIRDCLRPLSVQQRTVRHSKTALLNIRWAKRRLDGLRKKGVQIVDPICDCGAGRKFRQLRYDGLCPTITRSRGAQASFYLLDEDRRLGLNEHPHRPDLAPRYLTLKEMEVIQGFKSITWPVGLKRTRRGAMIGNAMSLPCLAAAMKAVLLAAGMIRKP